MPSSISISNDRLWPAPWLRTWITSVAIAVVLIGGWEGFWRARGFVPRRNDDVGWWAQERGKVYAGGTRSVVLLGSSRMQLGFDTRVFAQKTGIQPIQLAIDNDPGVDVLRDLANDANFNGTVVCELMEKYLVWIGQDSDSSQANQWLRDYHASNVFSRFEWRARGLAQTSLAFRLPDLSLQNLVTNLRQRRLPSSEPFYIAMNPDRSKSADYARTDLDRLKAFHEADVQEEFAHLPQLSPAEFFTRSKLLTVWVAAIEARGGRVIFLRFPSSGVIWQLENGRFPRPEFWDPLIKVRKLTAIHFAEYDTLKDFTCPDGTHLDYREAAPFTAAVTEIMLQKQLLPVNASR